MSSQKTRHVQQNLRRIKQHRILEQRRGSESSSEHKDDRVSPAPSLDPPPSLDQPPDRDANEESLEDVYPDAGRTIREEKGTFEKIEDQSPDPQNPFWPFSDFEDWEMAAWLATSGLSQKTMDSFFKLGHIKNCGLTYGCAVTLKLRIGQLPSPIFWESMELVPETNAHAPVEPLKLYWREPVDCIAKLLANPRLNQEMNFAPRKVYEDATKKKRLYNEMATGDWWWRAQDGLPKGSTIIPVILASDKTHLTTMVGDKEAWPLYLSIGNISQEIRNKASEEAFALVAYLPVAKFGQREDVEGVLRARFYHQAVEFVLRQVQRCGQHGIELPDANGNVRECYTLLAAHIADLPEQLLIAIAPHSHSPIMRISKKDFGSSKRGIPRSRHFVLRLLEKAKQAADPQTELRRYIKRCRFLGLSGVDKPFWAEHRDADPNLFLTPDHLHQVHKFFRDHILKWIKFVVALEKRNFWTGREDREIQRTILAVAVGGGRMTTLAVKNLRAALDFIYLSQYTSHSDDTLKYLSNALKRFHNTKDEWIQLGGRRGVRGVLRHFNIPKLPSWLHFEPSIREMGASFQFTSDTPEHGHILNVKRPHDRSNKREPTAQMCADLDRRERVQYRKAFISWLLAVDSNPTVDDLDEVLPVVGPADKALPMLDLEEMEICTHRFSIAIQLGIKPKLADCLLDTIGDIYGLDDFRIAVEQFYSKKCNGRQTQLSFNTADVWDRFRLQVAKFQQPSHILLAKTVQALAPSPEMPYGKCNTVLASHGNSSAETEDDGAIQAYSVVQVRCIFRPSDESVKNTLLYVQLFTSPPAQPEPHIDMYVVKRQVKGKKPIGAVIPLDSVVRMVQLIPKFGKRADTKFHSTNVLDIGTQYYINSFWDKEVYQAVY